MKRACSPSLKMDSKTIQCITRFQLIPPNLVSKDHPIFSAFSKPKLRRFHMLDAHDNKANRPQTQNYELKLSDENNYNSLLLMKNKQHNNMFEGLLKARKSHMKKIKLKEFYIEEYDERKEAIDKSIVMNEAKAHGLGSRNSTEFNTIDSKHSKHSQAPKKSFFLPSRKKVLPAKLRAKSYSNIPKNQRDQSVQYQDENSLFIKAKKSHNIISTQKSANLTIDHQTIQSQQSVKTNCRRNLRTGKIRKISHFEQKPMRGLQDITLQLNEQSIDLCSQKDLKEMKRGFSRQYKHRRNLKSQQLAKIQSVIDINPWMNNHNDDDKENQFFLFK